MPRIDAFGQSCDGLLELLGEVAVAEDAIARGVGTFLAGPIAQHHLGMMVKIHVDGHVHPVDGERLGAQPLGVRVLGWLAWCALAQEEDIRDDGGALPLEGLQGQADRPQEIRPLGDMLA